MLLQSFLRSHFPLLGCPDDLCYVRVVDYSYTDKVTPRKVFAPPAVIQPIDARFWTSRGMPSHLTVSVFRFAQSVNAHLFFRLACASKRYHWPKALFYRPQGSFSFTPSSDRNFGCRPYRTADSNELEAAVSINTNIN
jgi:hypothetical protein